MSDFDEAACRARVEDYARAYEEAMGGLPNRLPEVAHRIISTDVPALLTLLDEARAEVERLREVERHRDLLLNGFFASCPDRHEHGVWCGSAWVALTTRAEAAEAELAEARGAIERVKAETLREAASAPELRLRGHSGISVRGLLDRADRIERGEA